MTFSNEKYYKEHLRDVQKAKKLLSANSHMKALIEYEEE
jgi:hypothetical protein